MIVKASSGSPSVAPKLYTTVSIASITQAEQQDRFLQLGELNQLVSFLNTGNKRLEIAETLTKNANFLVSKAADKIFVSGSGISFLERPQASFLDVNSSSDMNIEKELLGSASNNIFDNLSISLFNSNDSLPPGFKPINIVRYGSVRMKKSLRDLDWFLRYLTYSLIAGDTNILSVNIRGLRELIDNACSSAAAIVALREMRKLALSIFDQDFEAQKLVQQYFNVVISEFESSSLSDKLRKRFSNDLQGLRLPQVYKNAGISIQKFVMKSSLSSDEKKMVIKACYRQVFERDISKAYNVHFTDLESQVKTGQLSIKEFVRALAKSSAYRKDFYEPFVNSRVVELAFKHMLGRGPSSLKEFQAYFSILSTRGLSGLIDNLVNSKEYADYFGEETVPYFRSLGEEAQESRNWGAQLRLFNYSAVFRKIPEFITLFSNYQNNLPDQHPYGIGNDPLGIQFGAIFPNNLVNLRSKSSLFGKDTRRILLRCGPGIYSQISNPSARKLNTMPMNLGPKVFNILNENSEKNNIDVIINAVYLRILGRLMYEEELSNFIKLENQLRNNSICVRDFVRVVLKSSVFRSLYWQPLYICKAIEYIHNKVIGRPTYGRQEINQYFEIVYKKGYYSMINAIVDSAEYKESFGDNVVPYERYIAPYTVSSRNLFSKIQKNNADKDINNLNISINNFIKLADIQDNRSLYNINQRIKQGVSSIRSQKKIFEVKEYISVEDKKQVIKAIYRQLFERDLNSVTIGDEFYNLEKAFLVKDLSVQELVEKLGSSYLYRKEFYHPYPNTKVIELGTKHFLGRAPNNQAEIRYYNQILASQGILSFIYTLVNSIEYKVIFGSNTVPYRRFPTLPAANFPNTEQLYNTFTKQNKNIIVPSFKVS